MKEELRMRGDESSWAKRTRRERETTHSKRAASANRYHQSWLHVLLRLSKGKQVVHHRRRNHTVAHLDAVRAYGIEGVV